MWASFKKIVASPEKHSKKRVTGYVPSSGLEFSNFSQVIMASLLEFEFSKL